MQKKLIYIRFYKPFRVLSAFRSPSHQRNLSEFGFPREVYPIGRLDYDSEGLLLLTNDNRFKTHLLAPRYRHPRVYYAQVENIPSEESLQRLSEGIRIADYQTRPCTVMRVGTEPAFPPRFPPIRYRKHIPTVWLKLILTEGKNRQVRRMTAAIGHPTLRLIRTQMDCWSLDGLTPGEWQFIPSSEIQQWLEKNRIEKNLFQLRNPRLRYRY